VFEDYIWPMFAEIADLTKVRTRPDAAQSPGVNP
jgi:hypothetical protein